MNCQNCNFEMPENSKFCPKCGDKINVPNRGENKYGPSIIDDISNHLSFLGYKTTIEKAKIGGEKDIVLATHDQRNNVVIFSLTPDMLLLKINLTTNKKWDKNMSDFINNANKSFNCARVYYDTTDERLAILRFEAVYTGQYSKEVFGHFFDLFNNDVDNIFRAGKNFDQLFIN